MVNGFGLVAERVKLLTRIINEFRKETGQIRRLTAVPDARCPVVRFVALDEVHCELSVCNLLGMFKSQFLRVATGEGGTLACLVIFIKQEL